MALQSRTTLKIPPETPSNENGQLSLLNAACSFNLFFTVFNSSSPLFFGHMRGLYCAVEHVKQIKCPCFPAASAKPIKPVHAHLCKQCAGDSDRTGARFKVSKSKNI